MTVNGLQNETFQESDSFLLYTCVLYFVHLLSLGCKISYTSNIHTPRARHPLSQSLLPPFHMNQLQVRGSHALKGLPFSLSLHRDPLLFSFPYPKQHIWSPNFGWPVVCDKDRGLDCSARGTMGLTASSKIQSLAHDPEACHSGTAITSVV